MLIFNDSQYLNWQNGHEVAPIYNSGRVTAADVHAVLPGAGIYHVVLSNKFSAVTPKTVEGNLQMTWQPGAAVLAQRQAAKAALAAQQKAATNALMRKMLLLIVASVVMGGGIVVLLTQRKKPAPQPAEEKEAA